MPHSTQLAARFQVPRGPRHAATWRGPGIVRYPALAAALLFACNGGLDTGPAASTAQIETGASTVEPSTGGGPSADSTSHSRDPSEPTAGGPSTGPAPSTDTGSAGSTSNRATGTGPPEPTAGAECISGDIQAALDVAPPGATVTLCNDTYLLDAPLLLPPQVTLTGESTKGVVLQQLAALGNGAGGSVVQVIEAHGARVTRLTLRGPDDGDQYAAIFVQDSNDVTIDSVEVYDFARPGLGYGVAAIGAVDALLVEDSYFEHNRHGVTCQASGGITNNVYRNNTFINHTDAAIDNHANSTGTQVLNNTIVQGVDSDTGADGIILQGLIDFVIQGNSIDMGPSDRGRHGILIQYVAAAATQTMVTGAIIDNVVTNVGNTGNNSSEIGLAIVADDPSMTAHTIVLSGNSASGATMANALMWDSPAGRVADPIDIPDTTLSYPAMKRGRSPGSSNSTLPTMSGRSAMNEVSSE